MVVAVSDQVWVVNGFEMVVVSLDYHLASVYSGLMLVTFCLAAVVVWDLLNLKLNQ